MQPLTLDIGCRRSHRPRGDPARTFDRNSRVQLRRQLLFDRHGSCHHLAVVKDLQAVKRELRRHRRAHMHLAGRGQFDLAADTLAVDRQFQHGSVGHERLTGPQAFNPLLITERTVHLHIRPLSARQPTAHPIQEAVSPC